MSVDFLARVFLRYPVTSRAALLLSLSSDDTQCIPLDVWTEVLFMYCYAFRFPRGRAEFSSLNNHSIHIATGTPMLLIHATPPSDSSDMAPYLNAAETPHSTPYVIEVYGVLDGAAAPPMVAVTFTDGSLMDMCDVPIPAEVLAHIAGMVLRGMKDIGTHGALGPHNMRVARATGAVMLTHPLVVSTVEANSFLFDAPPEEEPEGPMADVWALGITMHTLKMAAHPWASSSWKSLSGGRMNVFHQAHALEDPSYPNESHRLDCRPLLADFLGHCNARLLADRWPVDALLEHPWLTGHAAVGRPFPDPAVTKAFFDSL